MRKWKDEGTHLLKPIQRQLFLALGITLIIKTPIDIFVFNSLDWSDVLHPPLGLFIIWGIKFNGFYKIARMVAEYQIKKRDNKWR